MTTPNPSGKFRVNGLAIFGAAAVTVLFALVVGGNILFERASQSPMRVSESSPAPRPSIADAAPARSAPASTATAPAPVVRTAFSPPAEGSLPEGEFGKVIRRGEQLFMETGKNAPLYVGNQLNCVNCHLDAGRKADSAPLWASFTRYPAFRSKTGQVD
ncbi:MAG: hypothetical protein Q7U14_11420, partial [Lacisediminimonas sp.]|nr:hypothetical protein [Lacisediminimonas sp.]